MVATYKRCTWPQHAGIQETPILFCIANSSPLVFVGRISSPEQTLLSTVSFQDILHVDCAQPLLPAEFWGLPVRNPWNNEVVSQHSTIKSATDCSSFGDWIVGGSKGVDVGSSQDYLKKSQQDARTEAALLFWAVLFIRAINWSPNSLKSQKSVPYFLPTTASDARGKATLWYAICSASLNSRSSFHFLLGNCDQICCFSVKVKLVFICSKIYIVI